MCIWCKKCRSLGKNSNMRMSPWYCDKENATIYSAPRCKIVFMLWQTGPHCVFLLQRKKTARKNKECNGPWGLRICNAKWNTRISEPPNTWIWEPPNTRFHIGLHFTHMRWSLHAICIWVIISWQSYRNKIHCRGKKTWKIKSSKFGSKMCSTYPNCMPICSR
jgi:hypothetical protein